MKAAVGIGGSALDGTIEAEWRFARASGLAAASSFDDRAAFQVFPDIATDHIPIFEEILKLSSPTNASEQERRNAIVSRWTEIIDITHTALGIALQEFDSRISILNPTEDQSRTTQAGRYFEPHVTTATDPAYGIGRKHTNFPNYSDHAVLRLFYDIGASATPSVAERQVISEVSAFLNRVIPSWNSFRFVFDQSGFILDQSLLDLGSPLP